MTNNGETLGFDTAKAIWDKSYDSLAEYCGISQSPGLSQDESYDSFAKYFDLVYWNFTPKDLGMPNNKGTYNFPKICGAKAAQLSRGKVVDDPNPNKDSVTLKTETYRIGTGLNKRHLMDVKAFVDQHITTASDTVLREICTDIINGLVAGADSTSTITGGVSYDTIEAAKQKIEDAATADGKKFRFYASHIAFSSVGWNKMVKLEDFKTIRQYMDKYNGLKFIEANFISTQKNSKAVHAIVLDRHHFSAFLWGTPRTAGDKEIIPAIDAGMVIRNAEAGVVITEA